MSEVRRSQLGQVGWDFFSTVSSAWTKLEHFEGWTTESNGGGCAWADGILNDKPNMQCEAG